jgi:hypothetical protein
MFETVANVGGLDVQLIYFRGWGECKASKWVSDARQLRSIMTGLLCKSGHTQIRRVLDHVRKENQREPVNAVVFVGDACEETPADLYDSCPDVPLFVFQEGEDEAVREVFAQIAKLTKGAHAEFNANSAVSLAELLKAVAAFATGGVKALTDQNSAAARLLLTQIRKRSMHIIGADERLREQRGAKILIVGPWGVGKTYLLRTTALERALFLDIEAGDLSVLGRHDPTGRLEGDARHRCAHWRAE